MLDTAPIRSQNIRSRMLCRFRRVSIASALGILSLPIAVWAFAQTAPTSDMKPGVPAASASSASGQRRSPPSANTNGGEPKTRNANANANNATVSTGTAPSTDVGAHDHDSDDVTNPYDHPSTAQPKVRKITVPMRDGMVRVPGGRFTIGSLDPASATNEKPSRSVQVAPFWIDRTEVTVRDYRACVDKGTCPAPRKASPACTFDLSDPDLPVSCVRWTDADAYCRSSGKRLPSEAEWEFAARGTSVARFPWGGAMSSCSTAVTLMSDRDSARSCGRAHPARVGSHPAGASVYGVLDLSGNVEEWTADWYAEPIGPGSSPRAGSSHVLRGGGWLSEPSSSRTTSRNWGSALEAGPNVGFRCARSETSL